MLLGAVLLLPLLMLIMVASAATRERAILEIVLYERNAHDEYETKVQYELRGLFSPAGAKTSAEGQIHQVHPLALCNDGVDDSRREYGWVGVVKLDRPEVDPIPCLTLYEKTKHAIQKGATAVIFDVTDNEYAIGELHQSNHPALDRPVITVTGREARKLRQIIKARTVARARIKSVSQIVEDPPKDYFDMGIFLAFFIFLCIIGVVVVLKLRWKSRTRRLSMTDIAKRVIAKMETRKFRSPYDWPLRHSSSQMSGLYSLDSNAETCAICLEQYKDGQELRVVPCRHEFHRQCVDKWLIANRTCPLCLFNIIECPIENEGSLWSSPDPTNQHSEPSGILQHVPSSPSSNYNNLPAPVPISTEAELNNAYKFPVQAYSGYMYNEMATSNVHNVNRYPQTRHTSNVRDYYQQITNVNNAGTSNFRQTGFGTPHPGLHYVTTTNMGHGSAMLSPRCKSNMDRKMAHIHSPRARAHMKCRAVNNGVTCTSSDSENEFTWMSYTRQHAPHLHDSRSQCDADVSGTSTDPDLDDNLLKSSDGSNVDVSNNSTFGSSHVVSDVSSFDSKVYMTHGDPPGGAVLQGSRNNAAECCANMVSAHSLVQSMATPNVVGITDDSDVSLVSVDTSAISPNDISDSWSDKTCDIRNFYPHSGCPMCRAMQLCETSSNDAVTVKSVTSIACDISVDHCRGHLRTSGVGHNQRRSLVYWHDKTNALNRGRYCYSTARQSPWQRCHVSGHQVAWLQHSELHRPTMDDCSLVDCTLENRLAFDAVSRGDPRVCTAEMVSSALCAAAESRVHKDPCAMTDVRPVETRWRDHCETKARTNLLSTPRDLTGPVRDQDGPKPDHYLQVRDHSFSVRNHNSPARYNSGPTSDLSGLLLDHCNQMTDHGTLRDHCGSIDNNGLLMGDSGQTDRHGPVRDHSGPTRNDRSPWRDLSRATVKNHVGEKGDHNSRTRFNSGLNRDQSRIATRDPHRSHCAVEGDHNDGARADCAKAKYYVGTKRVHRGSTRCLRGAVNNPRIAQLTMAVCKETVVCQRPQGSVVTMPLGADTSYQPPNVV